MALHHNRAPGGMEIVFPNYATREPQVHGAFPKLPPCPRKRLIVR